MEPTPVLIKLTDVFCSDNTDLIGSAEPYLWVVYFKIDGDTVHVDSTFTLNGTATVVTTPGNHGNLPGSGENRSIPPALGEFSTVLTPIPNDAPVGGPVSGVAGCAVILMEQDSTSEAAVAAGHEALNQAIQTALDNLIPTLNFTHQSPTDDEISALVTKVGNQVSDAIADNVGLWGWLAAAGDMDDKVGAKVFYSSQADICKAAFTGVPIYVNEPDWAINGSINAVLDDLEVTCIYKPSGNVESHHIELLGGVFNEQQWRMTNTDVVRYIQEGKQFHVAGTDGSRSTVVVAKHWTSNANPGGLFLTTDPDDSKMDNLLSLPACTST